MRLLEWARDKALSMGAGGASKQEKRKERYPEPEYYDDEEDFYEDEDEYDEPAPTVSRFKDDGKTPFSVIYNNKVMGAGEREFTASSAYSSHSSHSSHNYDSAKVVPFAQAGGNQTIYIAFPKSIDECRSISDYVREGNSVVVNLEGIRTEGPKSEISQAQRVVDFLAGVVYSLGGDIQTVSNRVFLLVPGAISIAGDVHEGLKSAASLIPPMRAAMR